MRQKGSIVSVLAAATISALATAPLHAQKSGMSVGVQAKPAPNVYTPPPLPYPYVVAVVPRDDRTSRQRCWDDEAARIGGTLSDLDRRTIDLKCSQR